MLLRFNVSNFLSFGEEQEFSMIPGKARRFKERLIEDENLSLLKFCSLYGANASGKSNLIKAVEFAKKVIVEGIDNVEHYDMYCKLDKDNADKETKFEFEIKVNDKYYVYGFSLILNNSEIVGEWLYEIQPTKEIMIFERDMKRNSFNTEIEFKDEKNKSKFDVYADDIINMDNVLFLSEIKRKNLKGDEFEVFNEVYKWFKYKLEIIYPDTVIESLSQMFHMESNNNIIKLLDYFDTGITGCVLEESNLEELDKSAIQVCQNSLYRLSQDYMKELINTRKKSNIETKGILRSKRHLFEISFGKGDIEVNKLLFKHGTNSDLLFEFGEESDGTKRLIELLDVIHNDEEDKVFLIDELDRSLHPQMTRKFVETFFEASKGKNTQLFITTHESNLLDLNLLRRDEIWFVERGRDYTSKLYSLDNFGVRYDKKIHKAYLEGRYGAVPVFKNFVSYVSEENEEY